MFKGTFSGVAAQLYQITEKAPIAPQIFFLNENVVGTHYKHFIEALLMSTTIVFLWSSKKKNEKKKKKKNLKKPYLELWPSVMSVCFL